MSKVIQGMLAAATVLLAAAAPAGAADYFAAPGAAGTDPCPRSAPCALADAVSHSGDVGDRVLLEPGTYDVTFNVSLGNETLAPAQPGTRPLIRSTGGHTVFLVGAATAIEDVSLEITGLPDGSYGLFLDEDASARRVSLTATGGNGVIGTSLRGGSLLEGSSVFVPAALGSAIVTGGIDGGGTIRNVTAVATGTDSFGLRAPNAFGEPQTVLVQNSFLRGVVSDLTAQGDSPGDIALQIANSNYADSSPSTAFATITDLGGRQTGEPLFANPAVGDFHQLAGSPTIDAGAAVTGLGPLDLDGNQRVLGSAPDIGADEFAPPPAALPHPVPKKAKKKCKKPRKKGKRRLASDAKKKSKKCKKRAKRK